MAGLPDTRPAPEPYYQDDQVTVLHGDCCALMSTLADESVDAVVTDPPYGLEFMGKEWDRPWAVTAKAGVGFAGREDNLTLPSHRDSRNANCRACGGRQRGAKRCTCATPQWDRSPANDMRQFQAWCEVWAAECLRVLKPGGHMLAFGGTRTWHRLAAAVEDAGFEIRDSIAWLYGSGFPKSLDVSKAIDRAAGAEREVLDTIPDRWAGKGNVLQRSQQEPAESVNLTAPATDAAKRWAGWGTALKPAFEPIVVARKPIRGTVAGNVVAHGTGALNIDACRVEAGQDYRDKCASVVGLDSNRNGAAYGEWTGERTDSAHVSGRWPSNVVLDEHQAAHLDAQSGVLSSGGGVKAKPGSLNGFVEERTSIRQSAGAAYEPDQGGASRFFPVFKYTAKANGSERPTANGVSHPTVKPLDLMRWLVRLFTPPGGLVLDPFAGSGTTAEACIHEHLRCVTIEREPTYLPLIVARLSKPMAVGFDFEELA